MVSQTCDNVKMLLITKTSYKMFIARPSVRQSVRLSHGWISPKRLKLGSCNFPRPSSFCAVSFIQKF